MTDVHARSCMVAFAVSALATALALATPVLARPQDDPAETVDTLLDRAIARTRWVEQQGIRTRYRFTLVSQSRKLKKDGSVEKETRETYEVVPVRGVPYARLISKDGGPLEAADLGAERKRYARFLETIQRGDDPRDDDDSQIGFDEELVAKYDFAAVGAEMLDGRRYRVLAFQPRPGKLPTRRRIDTALNRSRGRIWVDESTYEVGRVQFELIDRVRLWWGIIGTLSEARGTIERRPIEGSDDAWFPRRADIYFNGRILFRSLHRSIRNEWRDFAPAGTRDP